MCLSCAARLHGSAERFLNKPRLSGPATYWQQRLGERNGLVGPEGSETSFGDSNGANIDCRKMDRANIEPSSSALFAGSTGSRRPGVLGRPARPADLDCVVKSPRQAPG